MTLTILLTLALLIAIILAIEVGRWVGLRITLPEKSAAATATEGLVFAILGLLIAFTFSNAAGRFDQRRAVIVDQVNALSTAWSRVDVLSYPLRPAIREPMLEWARLAARWNEFAGDEKAIEDARKRGTELQTQTWNATIDALRRADNPSLNVVLLPPLNEWMDLTTKRHSLDLIGTPPMVLPMLCVMSLSGAVLMGIHSARSPRSKLHIAMFAGVITFSVYVILDLNQPRKGLIRIDTIDQTMKELVQSFEQQLGTPEATPAPTK
jgi:hypothetical protein